MQKKIGIMQPYFFPYLGYWQLINYVDEYVVYDDVNFIKNGWINRNYILLNGKKQLITLPLDNASPFLAINQISFTKDVVQKRKILKTITHAYHNAPYYSLVFPMIEKMIMNQSFNISCALVDSINDICNYLGIKTNILLSSSINKNESLKGEDRVLHICELLGAKNYINAIGGQALYSSDMFQQRGIALNFLKMKKICYYQGKENFIENLSIIDVLMHNNKEQIQLMLEQFDLL